MSAQKKLGRQFTDEYGNPSAHKHAVVQIAEPAAVKRHQRATGLSMLRSAERPDFSKAPVTELPVSRLKPTQQFIWQGQAEAIRSSPDPGSLPPVDVVRKGSAHYLVDGHHRWDFAKERGAKTIRARVIDR